EFEFAPLEGNDPYRTRAYLKSNENGQALLAIFHGDARDLKDAAGAWDEMAETIRFDESFAALDLLKAGIVESRRRGKVDVSAAVATPEEGWVWQHVARGWKVGGTHVSYALPG